MSPSINPISPKKRPYYLSFDPNQTNTHYKSSADLLKFFGENTGNMAFVHAMSTQISGEKSFSSGNINISKIKDENDVLVFPAANNIGAKSDMGWLAFIIEKTDLPILIVGLGVQSLFGAEKFDLTNGTKRFIDIIKDRKISIGVRGSFTRDFLADFGVETAFITGCPSNFISPLTNLGERVEQKFNAIKQNETKIMSLALNLEYFRLESKKVQTLTRWVSDYSGSLILQSDEFLFSLMRGDFNENDTAQIKWRGKYFIGNDNIDNFLKWMHRYGRIYINASSWLNDLRTASLSIGSRFHGNMLAIQSETPAVVFPHDTRTLEMCNTMKIPYFNWDDIYDDIKIHNILENITFSASDYNARRYELASVYKSLVNAVGLSVGPHVESLAALHKV